MDLKTQAFRLSIESLELCTGGSTISDPSKKVSRAPFLQQDAQRMQSAAAIAADACMLELRCAHKESMHHPSSSPATPPSPIPPMWGVVQFICPARRSGPSTPTSAPHPEPHVYPFPLIPPFDGVAMPALWGCHRREGGGAMGRRGVLGVALGLGGVGVGRGLGGVGALCAPLVRHRHGAIAAAPSWIEASLCMYMKINSFLTKIRLFLTKMSSFLTQMTYF
jgi:hypothetical protein